MSNKTVIFYTLWRCLPQHLDGHPQTQTVIDIPLGCHTTYPVAPFICDKQADPSRFCFTGSPVKWLVNL